MTQIDSFEFHFYKNKKWENIFSKNGIFWLDNYKKNLSDHQSQEAKMTDDQL